MKKIYIAGCGGMLGEAFYSILKNDFILKCTDKDVNESWLEFLDFRDFEKYKQDVFTFEPDYLFHIGAYTDLEYCENNVEDTYLTNTISVENAVYIANKLNIPLLFIGTAGIFDGNKDKYDDWDTGNPLGVYARSKFLAENYVVNNANKYLICRAGWMMGGGPLKDKKFVKKLMSQINDGNLNINVVDDKDGTPTYTRDFVKTTMELIKLECWGVYNTVCKGETTRLEVAHEIISLLGLKNKVTITPVSSDFFRESFFATRPRSERLITTKLNLRKIGTMREWKISLKEYLDDYWKGYLQIL
jgi:dTDP-4-dehydrorhamnose reductase